MIGRMLMLAVALLCSVPGRADEAPPTVEQPGSIAGEVIARTTLDGCPASLSFRPADQGVRAHAHLRMDCPGDLSLRLATIDRLWRALVPGRLEADAQVGLFLGRLIQTLPELADEVAIAGARAGGGADHAAYAGRVRTGAQAIGLAALIAGWGFNITGVSVEKILAWPVEHLPAGLRDQIAGIRPARPVAHDAMVWLTLAPADS